VTEDGDAVFRRRPGCCSAVRNRCLADVLAEALHRKLVDRAPAANDLRAANGMFAQSPPEKQFAATRTER
jgi:hypothetical protein